MKYIKVFKIFFFIFKSITVIMSLFIFYECFVYHKMTHLTDTELEWVTDKDYDDTILFISNRGNIDSLFYVKDFISNQINPLYFSEAGHEHYEASCGYDFILKGKHIDLKGGFMIIKHIELDTIRPLGNIGGLYSEFFNSNPHEIKLLNDLHLFPIQQFQYQFVLFNDCIVFDETNSKYSEYWPDSTSVMYHSV